MGSTKRFLTRLATLVGALGAVALVSAGGALASADYVPPPSNSCGFSCVSYANDYPATHGWTLISRTCQSTGFTDDQYPLVSMGWAVGVGLSCAMNVGPQPAWQYVAGNWRATTLDNGQWAYVAPFTRGWTWAWTRRTGWTAVASTAVVACADPNAHAPAYVPICGTLATAR